MRGSYLPRPFSHIYTYSLAYILCGVVHVRGVYMGMCMYLFFPHHAVRLHTATIVRTQGVDVVTLNLAEMANGG